MVQPRLCSSFVCTFICPSTTALPRKFLQAFSSLSIKPITYFMVNQVWLISLVSGQVKFKQEILNIFEIVSIFLRFKIKIIFKIVYLILLKISVAKQRVERDGFYHITWELFYLKKYVLLPGLYGIPYNPRDYSKGYTESRITLGTTPRVIRNPV